MKYALLGFFLMSQTAFAAEHVQRTLWIGAGHKMDNGYLLVETRLKNGAKRVRSSHVLNAHVQGTKRLLPDDFELLRTEILKTIKPVARRKPYPACGHPLLVSTQEGRLPIDRQYLCIGQSTHAISRKMASIISELKPYSLK